MSATPEFFILKVSNSMQRTGSRTDMHEATRKRIGKMPNEKKEKRQKEFRQK